MSKLTRAKLITFWLPIVIFDLHIHGRDLFQSHKTTVIQVMKEALYSLISVMAFMPNTKPEITSIKVLETYCGLIEAARRKLNGKRRHYIWFGLTNDNLEECREALKRTEVIGLKVYSEWVISDHIIHEAMFLVRATGKVMAVHCDDPKLIEKEGYSITAEVAYVNKIIKLGKDVSGVKIMICHVSCRQAAQQILRAQREGMNILIELCIQYLYFDEGLTNRRTDLNKNFYRCLNRLRSRQDQEYFIGLLKSSNRLVVIHSDSACHTTTEKEGGANGLPSNQELVSGMVTLAIRHRISQDRVAQLLSYNASDFFNLPVPRRLISYWWKEVKNRNVYNNGLVTNPWAGLKMYFPVNKNGGN